MFVGLQSYQKNYGSPYKLCFGKYRSSIQTGWVSVGMREMRYSYLFLIFPKVPSLFLSLVILFRRVICFGMPTPITIKVFLLRFWSRSWGKDSFQQVRFRIFESSSLQAHLDLVLLIVVHLSYCTTRPGNVECSPTSNCPRIS